VVKNALDRFDLVAGGIVLIIIPAKKSVDVPLCGPTLTKAKIALFASEQNLRELRPNLGCCQPLRHGLAQHDPTENPAVAP
jgi:hypothetical protein